LVILIKRKKGQKIPEASKSTKSEQSKLDEVGAAAEASSRRRVLCCVIDATGLNTKPFIVQVATEGEEKEGRDAIKMNLIGAVATSPVSEKANALVCWPAAGGVIETLAVMLDSDGKAALHASTEVFVNPRVGLVSSVVMLTTLELDALSN
jgi:hypothetical protein